MVGTSTPMRTLDFTAVFNKFEKLTVTFDANGGIGTMDSVRIVNGASGEYYTLPECGFTREDYTPQQLAHYRYCQDDYMGR